LNVSVKSFASGPAHSSIPSPWPTSWPSLGFHSLFERDQPSGSFSFEKSSATSSPRAATNEELYTFAFLGRYHTVLDGVKCCILKGGGFAKVDPKMWIYPGRQFQFEVRCAKSQMQMFLDGELGPVFTDPAPPAPAKGMKLKILASTEGSKDEVKIDDVKVVSGGKK